MGILCFYQRRKYNPVQWLLSSGFPLAHQVNWFWAPSAQDGEIHKGWEMYWLSVWSVGMRSGCHFCQSGPYSRMTLGNWMHRLNVKYEVLWWDLLKIAFYVRARTAKKSTDRSQSMYIYIKFSSVENVLKQINELNEILYCNEQS